MDIVSTIKNSIRYFANDSLNNSLMNEENERAFENPLVGFSNGDDPLYKFFKEDIGSLYWEPIDIFKRTFPQLKAAPDHLTVISWILPQTRATKLDNQKMTVYPAEKWVRARVYGEKFNDKLRRHIEIILQKLGYNAVSPVISPIWKWERSKNYGFASHWSERHAAFVSGLGTFGLCDGLITLKGKAMRCGSVIANIQIEPTKRQYNDRNEYCLFFSKGLCGFCIKRCPISAISKKGHNKEKCEKYLDLTRKYVISNFGFEGYACGLCQTGVPCESKIPTENDFKRKAIR